MSLDCIGLIKMNFGMLIATVIYVTISSFLTGDRNESIAKRFYIN